MVANERESERKLGTFSLARAGGGSWEREWANTRGREWVSLSGVFPATAETAAVETRLINSWSARETRVKDGATPLKGCSLQGEKTKRKNLVSQIKNH